MNWKRKFHYNNNRASIIRGFFYGLALVLFIQCTKTAIPTTITPINKLPFIQALDLSESIAIQQYNVTFKDSLSKPINLLQFAQQQGINTIRLRVFKGGPQTSPQHWSQVAAFAEVVQSYGLRIWLTVHYSDTWADPAHQSPPESWKNLTSEQLTDSATQFTKLLVEQIQPDIYQIGNEINPGILLPYGSIEKHYFTELINSCAAVIRAHSPETQIMLHCAGHKNALWFYNQCSAIDYDYIGVSHYPMWHGFSLDSLQETLQMLQNTFNKPVLIAETAYPFTLGYNDFTNNIVGLENQLMPEFKATPIGQLRYLQELQSKLKAASAKGWCYWAADWVAYKGDTATNGSPWENQALFDFSNEALPAWQVYKSE